MFNYYDNRMKRRLTSLKRNSSKNTHVVQRIVELSKFALDYIQWEEAVQKIKKEVLVKQTSDISSINMKNDLLEQLAKHSQNSQIPSIAMGLETDDPEGEEGIDFLQREQNKNMLQLLQYKEKSKI